MSGELAAYVSANLRFGSREFGMLIGVHKRLIDAVGAGFEDDFLVDG
jgi:hypothetical protein